jgi:hypothetical protein
MTDELDDVRGALDGMRTGVLKKLAGLSAEEARRSTVPSGTNLAGLVQHLTFVESRWFEEIVAGGSVVRGQRSMLVDPTVSLSTLRADYRAAVEASNAIMTGIGDMNAAVAHGDRAHNLRSAVLSVFGETARHAGHADIIREQIDGRTGR